MLSRLAFIIAAVAVIVAMYSSVSAVPQQINYQGSLTRPDGTPLDTTVAMTFKLYSEPGGALLWTEVHAAVAVSNGLFNATLGSITSLDDNVLIEMLAVDGGVLGISVGSDSEMSPQIPLSSVFYARRVESVDAASGGYISSDVNIQGSLRAGTHATAPETNSIQFGVNAKALGVSSSVLGGRNNNARGDYSTVAGGGGPSFADSNTASGGNSFVGGGLKNRAAAARSSVVGGLSNIASDSGAVVSGGANNTASGKWSVVAGGGGFVIGIPVGNTASGTYSAVSGGTDNNATGSYSVISGGSNHDATNSWATISGGLTNTASAEGSTVGGGGENEALGNYSVVAGGGGPTYPERNIASGDHGAVLGGRRNIASGSYATAGGGDGNKARGNYSVVSGGGGSSAADSNSAAGHLSAVSGGRRNAASDSGATVGGGTENVASSKWAVVTGGRLNAASGVNSTISGGQGNTASGSAATVAGGYYNAASESYSFAAGYRARANHYGAFVWGSGLYATDSTASFNSYTFTARCANGARFYTASTGTGTGVQLPAGGGAWASLSDRNQKDFHSGVNTSDILKKVSSLPLHKWSYKSQDESIQHLGPTAQDFYEAFGLGDNNTTISTLDPDGVLLAAVQELAKEISELRSQNAALQNRVQTLEASQHQTSNITDKSER